MKTNLWIFILDSALITNLLISCHNTTVEIQSENLPYVKLFLKDKNPSAKTRIIGGEEVRPHSHPYIVALSVYEKIFPTKIIFCGGSLITVKWILTAAHCVDTRPRKIDAILGAHDLSISEDTQQISVTYYILHVSYEKESMHNDIALLMLAKKAELNQNIKTIQLATVKENYLSKMVTIAGWGRTETEESSSRLRSVKRGIVSNPVCDKQYKNIIPSQLCTSGVGKKSSCVGDSGGPLVVDNMQIGIFSFGTEDCTLEAPSVYTRTVWFNKWIWDSMKLVELRYDSSKDGGSRYSPFILFISFLFVAF